MHRLRSTKSIATMIIIISSFIALPFHLLNGLPFITTTSLTPSQLFEDVYGENDQGSEVEAYSEFVSSIQPGNIDSSIATNATTTTTAQVPKQLRGLKFQVKKVT